MAGTAIVLVSDRQHIGAGCASGNRTRDLSGQPSGMLVAIELMTGHAINELYRSLGGLAGFPAKTGAVRRDQRVVRERLASFHQSQAAGQVPRMAELDPSLFDGAAVREAVKSG